MSFDIFRLFFSACMDTSLVTQERGASDGVDRSGNYTQLIEESNEPLTPRSLAERQVEVRANRIKDWLLTFALIVGVIVFVVAIYYLAQAALPVLAAVALTFLATFVAMLIAYCLGKGIVALYQCITERSC